MNREQVRRNFCRNVSYIRRIHKLTQKQMAEILGVSVSSVRKMEAGREIPRLSGQMLCRVCDAFDLSADAFLRTELEQDK